MAEVMSDSAIYGRSDVDINVLLLEMQGKVIKFRLRVSEFFQDYDKLRSGLEIVLKISSKIVLEIVLG